MIVFGVVVEKQERKIEKEKIVTQDAFLMLRWREYNKWIYVGLESEDIL